MPQVNHHTHKISCCLRHFDVNHIQISDWPIVVVLMGIAAIRFVTARRSRVGGLLW